MSDVVIEDIWGHAERRSNDTYALSCRSTTIGDNGTVNNSSGYETDDVSDSEEYHFEYAITTGSDADSVEIPGAYAITPVMLPDGMDESGDTAPSTVPSDLKEEIRRSWYKSVWLIVITTSLCVLVSTIMVIIDSQMEAPVDPEEPDNPPPKHGSKYDPFLNCERHGVIPELSDDLREAYDLLKTSTLLRDYLLLDGDVVVNATSCTPENMALVWLACDQTQDSDSASKTFSLNVVTRFVLVLVYTTMGGNDWSKQENWLSHSSECIWDGIECDEEGNMVELVLDENNLSGSLESRLGVLSSLRVMDFSDNELVGSIPWDSWDFPSLEEVHFANNKLTGTLPELGEKEFARSLKVLSLDKCVIEGTVPDLSRLVNLVKLHLSDTLIADVFPFKGLEKLTHLEELLLHRTNAVQGTLPSSLDMLANLKLFVVTGTYMYGTIPESIGNMVALESFNVGGTHLSGSIPTTFGKLTNLKSLDMITGSLEGTLPSELGSCSNLESFDVSGNIKITGTIPSEMASCSNLNTFRVSSTSLTGTVPPKFENLMQLGELTISCSPIIGPLPVGVCERSTDVVIHADQIQQGSLKCSCCDATSRNGGRIPAHCSDHFQH